MFAWKVSQLEAFAELLTKPHPLIHTEITGINHSITMDGQSYSGAVSGARSERETYQKMPLLYDEPPACEETCKLVVQGHELVGFMPWPPAIVQGSMGLCRDTAQLRDDGVIGWLSITSRDLGGERAVQPLLNYHIRFNNPCELIEARTSLQAALSGNGHAWANFVVNPIVDKVEWVEGFREKGYYCCGFDIIKVYLNAATGRMLDS